jgi:hypothetical protein
MARECALESMDAAGLDRELTVLAEPPLETESSEDPESDAVCIVSTGGSLANVGERGSPST